MPALQVRDMPEQLYGRVKALAESEHRSIAQQTIIALEAMVQNGQQSGQQQQRQRQQVMTHSFDSSYAFGSNGSRLYTNINNKQRRKMVFDAIRASNITLDSGAPSPADVARQGRDERQAAQEQLFDDLKVESGLMTNDMVESSL